MSASASASTLSSSDSPAPLDTTNTIDLVSIHHSKITNVSLYAGRAEITRLYHFTVKTGQNQVNIKGLPAAVDRPSLRCALLLFECNRSMTDVHFRTQGRRTRRSNDTRRHSWIHPTPDSPIHLRGAHLSPRTTQQEAEGPRTSANFARTPRDLP